MVMRLSLQKKKEDSIVASLSGPLGPNSPITLPQFDTISAKKTKKKKKTDKSKKKEQLPKDSAEISDKKPVAEAAPAAEPEGPNPVKDAKEIPGLFKLYKEEGHVFFSIAPEQLNKPFFFSSNVSKSIGERRLVGSEMGDSYLAEFRKVDNRIQLVALHTQNFAEPGSPQEKFVEEDYSDSLISSAPITAGSQPNGEMLVSANDLLFTDISGYQARMQWAYDTPFGMDPRNTTFTQVDNNARQTSFGVQAHFQAPLATPGDLPSTTPIPNSALAEFRYNFLKLPETPMKPRLADDRIGHFVTTRKDYTGDVGDGKVRYVNRWRLEKADPNAEMSKPVKPITYWVANNVPEKYREAVAEGILEWNKAFEAIGFQDAIVVKHQKPGDTFDTLDAEHASVRWYTAADVGSAVGPSHVDPRSGEILDADIRMADVFGRSAQRLLMDNPPKAAAHQHTHAHTHDGHVCNFQHHASNEHEFAHSLLAARGDAEAAQELADAYIKDVVMHEVGHTLGLRHNFRGSTIHTPEQLTDAEFTKENGLGSSVMDYHPFNLAGPDEKQGEYVMSSLGAYDFLAVKYAYGQFDPALEDESLKEIAKKTTTDPKLSYETDEAADAMDPSVSRFDLGNDPLEYSKKQIVLANELWDRAQTQELPEGTSYKELTRAFSSGLRKIQGAAELANRYVGAVYLRRDHAGTGKPIYEPYPAEQQREAVDLITKTMFSPESFKFKPEFLSRLGKERFGQWGDQNIHVGKIVTKAQSRALSELLDKDIAQRLITNPEKLSEGTPVYKLSEMYQTLQNSVWSEVPAGTEISQGRRELQREYLKAIEPIITGEVKKPGEEPYPGEARSLMRFLANRLKGQIDTALLSNSSLETQAHLDDCKQRLAKVLGQDS